MFYVFAADLYTFTAAKYAFAATLYTFAAVICIKAAWVQSFLGGLVKVIAFTNIEN